jgi:DNA-binding MarR family transcriptional regulator
MSERPTDLLVEPNKRITLAELAPSRRLESVADNAFSRLHACVLDRRTTKLDVAIYSCLLSRARGNRARPSRVRLAKETGMSYINITRHTKKLERLGYITIERSKGYRTNVYVLRTHLFGCHSCEG